MGVVLVAVAGAVGGWLAWGGGSAAPAGPRAVIIDELAVTDPNPGWVRNATQLLRQDGFAVDYFGASQATVSLYRNLGTRGYRYVIIRSHSYGQRVGRDSTLQLGFVGLFTSERYSTSKHVPEQRAGTVDVAYFPARKDRYFGINQQFVQSVMRGRFDSTTVILMGCDGLSSDGLAQAFIARGASSFISWDREVSATHTDEATTSVLRHLLVDHMSSQQAVDATMRDVGPDPAFQSRLLVYP